MKISILRYLLFAIGYWAMLHNVLAQVVDDKERETAFYIDLNKPTSRVFEIQSGLLSLRYDDKFARNSTLSLKIYDWRREIVATYSLAKVYGSNYFNIQVASDAVLETGKMYSCVTTDESGVRHEIFFRPVEPLESKPPEVALLVNPLSFDCEDPMANVIEFYGEIKNGKAPYSVNWYVLNRTRSSFIYQPRSESIARPGNTTIIQVDKSPEYYVMLLVTDACGAETRQMINVTCGDKKKKINTVFVEPIDMLPGNLRQIN